METNSLLVQKEVLFQLLKLLRPIDITVILTSVTALYLFRLQDGYQLNPIWQLKQSAYKQDHPHAQPLIVDIDGDGMKEIVIASGDRIEIFSYHDSDFGGASYEHEANDGDTTQGVLYHLHLKNQLKFSEIIDSGDVATYPVAMNAGCLTSSYSGLCSQSLALVWSDWTVTLLSDQLKILWKSTPLQMILPPKLQITEMSALVVEKNSSIYAENGLVVLGGVLRVKEDEITHSQRHDHSRPTIPSEISDEISKERAGVEPNSSDHGFYPDLDPKSAKFVGHYTSYALDGKTGEIKWKHEPGDFEPQPDFDEENYSHLHFKLRLRKNGLHTGEAHWKKFGSSILKHLPYSWQHYTNSDITLGLFERSLSPTHPKQRSATISEQFEIFLGNTYGDKTAELRKNYRANVVVLRHQRAIEVLSLENGSPVCVLPLDTTKRTTVGDINGDEKIDTVKMYIHRDNHLQSPHCYIVASDSLTNALIHFNSSVCYPPSFFGFFDDPNTSASPDVKMTSLPPLLVTPLERPSGISHHILGYGLSPSGTGMDSFVLLSSGKLSAVGPSGRFLWQIYTGVTWSENDSGSKLLPSMKVISSNAEGTEDAVLILGENDILAVSLVDGSILSTHSLPCTSTHPLVSGDINSDLSDEFVVRCSDRYIGFSLERYNRIGLTVLMYSGITCLVVLLLFIIKFIEREEVPVDTFGHIARSLRLLPAPGTRF